MLYMVVPYNTGILLHFFVAQSAQLLALCSISISNGLSGVEGSKSEILQGGSFPVLVKLLNSCGQSGRYPTNGKPSGPIWTRVIGAASSAAMTLRKITSIWKL